MQSELHEAKSNYRWALLAALWFVYASFGLVLGAVPPMVVYLSEDLHLTRTAMGSVLGAWQLIYIVFAIPAGALIDRAGLRVTLVIGAGLIALSGVLRAAAVNHATLYLAVAVFGLGGPFISIGAPKLISSWFDTDELGTAMGIYLTAPSVGRIVALVTANAVLMPLYDSSWRLTLATYGGVAALSGVTWWLVARSAGSSGAGRPQPERPETAQEKPGTPRAGEARPPDAQEPASKGGHSRANSHTGVREFIHLIRIRAVAIVLFMSFGSFLFNHGLNNWLPEILRTGGMSVNRAAFWAVMPTAVGLIATLVIPRLATPKRRIWILVTTLALASVSAMVINHASGALLATGLLLAGMAGRGVMPILMLILIESPRIGPERMGSAGGLFFTAGEVGGVLGPLLLGILSDMTGDFSGGLYMLAGTNALLILLAVWLVAETDPQPRA